MSDHESEGQFSISCDGGVYDPFNFSTFENRLVFKNVKPEIVMIVVKYFSTKRKYKNSLKIVEHVIRGEIKCTFYSHFLFTPSVKL